MEFKYEKRKLRKYLGNNLYNLLKQYNCIIAGGAILSLFSNTEINDIDVYFRNKNDLADMLNNEMEGQWIVAYTKKAFLFKYEGIKVQTIYFRYFDSPEEIFDSFDFTVCMGAFDFKQEEFVLHKDFLRHNVSKTLKFNENTAYPIVSAIRVDKYKKKGFYISKVEYIKIILTIMNLKIDTYEELKEQMGGMYGENYDALLEPSENDEFNLPDIIRKIGDIGTTDYDYSLISQTMQIDDFDEFVLDVIGVKIKCFEYEGKYYRYFKGEFEEINIDKVTEDKYELTTVDNVVRFPMVLYKFVRQDKEGILRSFYDNRYVWRIGENTTDSSYGLFATKANDLKYSSYANKDSKVCLELLCEKFDDILVSHDNVFWEMENTYKRLVATRLVPRDEVERMTGVIQEDLFD